jgi:hypothetical protein
LTLAVPVDVLVPVAVVDVTATPATPAPVP